MSGHPQTPGGACAWDRARHNLARWGRGWAEGGGPHETGHVELLFQNKHLKRVPLRQEVWAPRLGDASLARLEEVLMRSHCSVAKSTRQHLTSPLEQSASF